MRRSDSLRPSDAFARTRVERRCCAFTDRYQRAFPNRRRRAFTIVELIVVAGIIVLLLSLGLPAFNAMSREANQSKARQLIQGALTRAAIRAGSGAFVAVRFMPAQWAVTGKSATALKAAVDNRQYMATYHWVNSAQGNPNNLLTPRFADYFERLDGGAAELLPTGVWAAPSEAIAERDNLTANRSALFGAIGKFEFDASRRNTPFLDADDFLIVFGGRDGLQPSTLRTAWQIKGFIPADENGSGRDIEAPGDPASWSSSPGRRAAEFNGYARPLTRFNYTGVTLYPREAFVALGVDVEPGPRRDLLRRTGLNSFVHPTSGTLIDGGRRP